MFLAGTPIFESLSELLGVPSLAIEGGAVVLLAIALIKLLQILFLKEKEDVKQLDLSSQLVMFAARSLEVSEGVKTAIEENTKVLDSVKMAFQGFISALGEEVMPLKDGLEKLRRELISNRKTRVVVKDSTGKVVAEVTAEPAVDENGEDYLIVQYDMKQRDEQLPG